MTRRPALILLTLLTGLAVSAPGFAPGFGPAWANPGKGSVRAGSGIGSGVGSGIATLGSCLNRVVGWCDAHAGAPLVCAAAAEDACDRQFAAPRARTARIGRIRVELGSPGAPTYRFVFEDTAPALAPALDRALVPATSARWGDPAAAPRPFTGLGGS